ncbi:MAG TPA: FHA domain-containing protein [Casimicrobiaceae bacterium]
MKGWLLGKVHGPGQDGRRVAPSLQGDPVAALDSAASSANDAERRSAHAHLGPYAPLISAIRDELEQFVERQLRLHLAIAERDRYVLSSIEVGVEGDDMHATLLRRFMAEFTPEQIKRFLARDVIAGLRNASAIDLAQFAGLNVEQGAKAREAEEPYAALIAELKSGAPEAQARPFEVALVGRWVHGDAATTRVPTPLSTPSATLEIDDATGRRRVDLAQVTPGRRYIVGKDAGADVVVDGTYASRRHCELWLDHDGWRVADAGSTNGIRVENGRSTMRSGATDRAVPLALGPGSVIVLSAHARGDARDYPRLRFDTAKVARTTVPRTEAVHAPSTPLAPTRRVPPPFVLTASMASGARDFDIAAEALPFGIGRSRTQALVVDGAHADVSGRHVEIVGVDEQGATVAVLGDNGVSVGGVEHPLGARFVWKPGETMLIGRADGDAPACTLSLAAGA